MRQHEGGGASTEERQNDHRRELSKTLPQLLDCKREDLKGGGIQLKESFLLRE